VWSEGYAEWTDEGAQTAYLSIAFTWLLNHAAERALSYRMHGWRVIAGGPALFQLKMYNEFHELADFVEVGTAYPDVVTKHNPDATIASRGCPGKGTEEKPDPCGHCIVPRMWGTKFTMLSDFVPRPVLCDDNLSALPADYQDFIIRRYQEAGVKLRDANSGFEPVTFTEAVYRRWKPILAAGGSPWRFGFDETVEAPQVRVVLKMLAAEPPKRKRPYVLIGNEPWEPCVARIYECISESARNAATGRLSPMCEPYVQWEMKLVALEKKPWVRFDWTAAELYRVQKWINSFAYRTVPLKEFKPNMKRERYDAEQGLFV
jgi:hypothetical protein